MGSGSEVQVGIVSEGMKGLFRRRELGHLFDVLVQGVGLPIPGGRTICLDDLPGRWVRPFLPDIESGDSGTTMKTLDPHAPIVPLE